MTVGGLTFLLPVAVAPTLPHAVILGKDVPTLLDLIHNSQSSGKDVTGPPGEPARFKPAAESVHTCNLVITRAQTAGTVLRELPYFGVELETRPGKPVKSKAQRRREKLQGTARKGLEELSTPECPLDSVIPPDVGSLQREDSTLKPWFEKVTEMEGVKQANAGFREEATYVVRGGILYQCKKKVEALVLPQQFRHRVMELGHTIPWAGHMGFQKTLNRIASRFVWPGMFTQITEFCSSCEKCQLTAGRGVVRAQLQPLPIIKTPFERIAMDIVGPLERSSTGNRYILVICDYATRYPEAFPLKSVKARQVANCLLQLFSRVGIAREILTDCGTNFLSTLLRQVYQLLGVKGIKTTPYHPQTDGLVERYNQTLKGMLRKFVSSTGADWDQWLPYLLFAYREVPQVSTGFSPFELLYGREVKGPLDLLKDHWESPKPEGENVVAYVVKMRERLERMTALAQGNMEMAQQCQKTWYDQKARERVFSPGQQVLVLLPTSDSKLLTRWHGPYEVTRRTGKVTLRTIHARTQAQASELSCQSVEGIPCPSRDCAAAAFCTRSSG